MKIAVGVMLLAASSGCVLAKDASNPVVTRAREIFQPQSAYMVAAAEQMPADKYGYPFFPMGTLRIYGVLQRIAICHLIGSVLDLASRRAS
jgi:predicted acyltransferase